MLREIFHGFIRVHILYHASKEPMSGAFMMKELRRHGYHISPGTLYPILHKMEAQGFLEGEWKVINGKRVKLYSITEKGLEVLKESKAKIKELFDEIMEE
jgi:DNA-binding PadR family transcriptional regulator